MTKTIPCLAMRLPRYATYLMIVVPLLLVYILTNTSTRSNFVAGTDFSSTPLL